MNVTSLLLVPALGAALLALIGDERKAAWLNVLVSFLTFGCALECCSASVRRRGRS